MDETLNTTNRVATTRSRRDAEGVSYLWSYAKAIPAGLTWTCIDVAYYAIISRQRVRRIVRELERQGLVEQVTPHRRAGGGSVSATWQLTEAGRRRQDVPIIRTRP